MVEPLTYDDADIARILRAARAVAVVGASASPARPSHGVMRYLQTKGYRVIPVNPRYAGEDILGEKVVASLADIESGVDLVDIFRAPDAAGGVFDEAIREKDRLGISTVWMQLGIRDDAAAVRAEEAGLTAIMDRCTEIEYSWLIGIGALRQRATFYKPPSQRRHSRIFVALSQSRTRRHRRPPAALLYFPVCREGLAQFPVSVLRRQ